MKPISALQYDRRFYSAAEKAQAALGNVGTFAAETSELWEEEKLLKSELIPLAQRIMNGEENSDLVHAWFKAQRAWLAALRAAQEAGGSCTIEMEKYARLRLDVLLILGQYLPTMEEAEKQKEGALNAGPKLSEGY